MKLGISITILFLAALALAPFVHAADVNAELAPHRAKIDAIDEKIVALLNERAQVVREVGLIKRKSNLPATAPARAEQVLQQAAARSKGPLDPAAVRRIYAKILKEMTAFEDAEMKKAPKR
jgi:chorismate mutase-like protein